MTKKDYKAIAAIIKKNTGSVMAGNDRIYVKDLINDLSEYMETDNRLFDKARFSAACGYGITY